MQVPLFFAKHQRVKLRILHEDQWVVAIDKPAGFYVHPPEDGTYRISKIWNCQATLRDQLGHYVYPLHRLDRPTAGVVLYAKAPEHVSAFQNLFRERRVNKTYFAVVRGWVSEEGRMDAPLDEEIGDTGKFGAEKESLTFFSRLAQVELPFGNTRFPTSRYSLVKVDPQTGRFHQIRRHFQRESHPLVGDTVYGDGKHNRIFRNELKIPGLLLKAQRLDLLHPFSGERLQVESRWGGDWHRVFDIFGICPYFSQST